MTRSTRDVRKRSHLAIALAVGQLLLAGSVRGDEAADAGTQAALEEIRHWNQAGRSADAERAARAVLKDAERVRGPESIEVAVILDELAVALRRGGKSAEPEALEVCQRAVRIKERVVGRQDPRYATSLYNLGLLYLGRKNYEAALSIFNETLEIRKQALGSNHPDVAKSLLALGSVNHDLGNYADGLALTERAVAIEETALGATNPERALGLNALAVARYSTGDFSGSIPLYEEAIGLWERSPAPNQGVIATCCNNLGAAFINMGDPKRAIGFLERALRLREELYGVNHPLVAVTLTGLGDALRDCGDLSGAKARYRRAIKIFETAAPRDSDIGWIRSKLGWVYLDEGDLVRARESFLHSIRDLEAGLGPNHPDLWMSLRGMAMVEWKRGAAEAARAYYERTVDLVRRTSGPRHPDLGLTLAEYASFQLSTGDSLASLNTALLAAEVNREHLRLTSRGIAERQALLYTSALKTGLDVACVAVSGRLGSRPDLVRRVLDAVVRSRALVLDEVAERARMVGGAGMVVEVAKRLEAARNRLANLLVLEASGEAPERDRALVATARDDVERAERELATRSASFRRGQDRAALGWDQVVSAVPQGAALISFVGYRDGRAHSFLGFVLGANRIPKVVPLGSAEEIDRLIIRWRRLAGMPPGRTTREAARAEADCRTAGQALRVRVWDPLASSLVGSRMILIVPDGSFDLLNFVALPTPEGGYLIESPYVIHYLSAERDIVTAEGLPSRGSGLLAVGGASFDMQEISRDSISAIAAAEPRAHPSPSTAYREAMTNCDDFRSYRFGPLPETVGEIAEISGIWGRQQEVILLEGRGAGEGAVKQLLPGRRVAHFATHAFFLSGNCVESLGDDAAAMRGIGGITPVPAHHSASRAEVNPFLLSGLALAGANRRENVPPGAEDGILTAEEIASLDLSGLDWVVLSACDTGVGEVQSGEGVLGLRRAFEVAGAGTLIMSLWAVEDRSAREWMRILYEGRFRKNLETAEAVHEADLTALKSLRGQGRSTHPFYWAAFVAVGGWG
jgi:tetratricopeptide (TPR) repeat protein/CHAT domain-containing protein